MARQMRDRLPAWPSQRVGLNAPDVQTTVCAAALLADRTRASIIAMLRAGPLCVCEMAAALGERQNNVSNHLARLREAGLVRAARHQQDARWIYYERDEEACAAALGALRGVLDPGPRSAEDGLLAEKTTPACRLTCGR